MEIYASLHKNSDYSHLLQNDQNDILLFSKKLFTSRKEYQFYDQNTPLPSEFVAIQDTYIVLQHLTNSELSSLFNVKGKHDDMINELINEQQQRLVALDFTSKIQPLKGILYRLDMHYERYLAQQLIIKYCIRNTKDLVDIFLLPPPIKTSYNNIISPLDIDYANAVLLLNTAQRIIDPMHYRYKDIGDAKLVYVNHLMQHIESRLPSCKPHSISYLNRYTVGDVYVKILLLCVLLVDSTTQYNIFRILLMQPHFKTDQRGKWYIEAAKLMDYDGTTNANILKSQFRILAICEKGINDKNVHCIDKLVLSKKAEKLQIKLNTLKASRVLFRMKLIKAPELKIKAIKQSSTSNKPLYRTLDANENEQGLVVEEFVLQYYRKQGYKGIHCESRFFKSVFHFFLHHLIYKRDLSSSKPVFVHDYQRVPLDMYSIEFYKNREQDLLEWLGIVETYDAERIRRLINRRKDRINLPIIGVALPGDKHHTMTLDEFTHVCCLLQGKVISRICKYISYNYARNMSGGPDLIIWKEEDCKMIEVKGVGDTLQINQQIWASHLMECNAPIYTLYVHE